MNKVYKSIWNAVTRSWTAVSEIQHCNGKKTKIALTTAIISSLIGLPTAYAANDNYWLTEDNVIILGDNNSAPNVGNLTFSEAELIGIDGLNYNFDWSDETQSLTTGTTLTISSQGSELLSHSQGLVQTLLTVNNLIWYPGANTYDSVIVDSDRQSVAQTINQNNQIVGTGYYAVGTGAYQLLMANQTTLDVSTGDDVDGHVNVQLGTSWDNYANAQFSDTGLKQEGGNAAFGDDGWFSTLSLLTGFDINPNQTLTLTLSDSSNWYTKLHGDETTSIRYVGNGSSTINIIALNDGADFKLGSSDYKGKTYFEDITANLRAVDSLGQTALLDAKQSTVNVFNTSSVGQLNLVSSNLNLEGNDFNVGSNGAKVDADSHLTGDQASLTVTGGDLLVQSQNAQFTASTVSANNITVNYTDAFGTGTTSRAQQQYVFDGVTGTQTNGVTANQVVLKANDQGQASNVIYNENTSITATNGTLIQGGSQLEVTGIGQLGGTVTFQESGESLDAYNKLTIHQTGDLNGTDTWTFGNVQFESDNANAIVVAQGDPNSNLRFTIPGSSQWTDYKGWLRISNTSFNLNSNLADSIFSRDSGESVGLSVGSNGHVNISNREVNIDRFGWSNDGGNNGVLDISHITQPTGNTSPILTVTDFWLQGGGSIMMLDPKVYLQQGSAATNDSVLDYQTSDNRFYLIEATGSVLGSGEIQLVDQNGNVITEDTDTVAIYGTDQDNAAANGTWTYNAQLDKNKDDGKQGVYLTYSLTSLELLGSTYTDRALQLNLQDAQHRELSIPVSGTGIVQINAEGTDDKTIKLSNAGNTFSGLVDAGTGVQLTATAGALGTGSTALRLADGATFNLENAITDTGKTSQQLNGISLGTGSSINLSENTTLELALNSEYMDQTAPVSSAEIGTDQLRGLGNLTLTEGTLSFTDASDLFAEDGYLGDLTVNDTAVMAFSGVNFTLKELHGNGTASLDGQAILGDLSDYSGDLKLEDSAVLVFTQGTKLRENVPDTLDVKSDHNNIGVRFHEFSSDASTIIDEYVSFDGNINNFSFEFTQGQFVTDRKLNLSLVGNSKIIRERDYLDQASIGEGTELIYKINQNANSYDLSEISEAGTLTLAFTEHNDALTISQTNNAFTGTFRFDNATFEVGDKHNTTGDVNNTIAENNSLYVGEESTLVLNGKQTLGKALTLGSGSSLDFTANSDSFVMQGTSVNALDMNNNAINLAQGENIEVSVVVDTSIAIKKADTSGTLMQAVRDQARDGLSQVLVNNIGGENAAQNLASHMQLVGTDGNVVGTDGKQSATVTYQDNEGAAIADITTSVGLAGVGNQIGLTYDKVTQVAIYDGQTAVFEATGEAGGDVISAQITNKENGTGSVHYTGEGTVTLTNSNNNYTGTTTIDDQASVIANANNTLGHSSKVIVGTDSMGSLQVNADQEHLGGLVVNTNGSLAIAEGKTMTITGSTDSAIAGNLDGKGTIRLVDSDLTYTTDVEKVLSAAFETDADSTLTKNGTGKLNFERTLSNLNLNLAQGGVVLDNGDTLRKFTVAEGTEVDVNGLVNIAELTGTGATFNMAVAFGDGSQEELKDGQTGLHIGTGSGDHFLNVTSKDLNKGAEESIKVVQIDEGDATFSLANGLEAVTSGAFDYTLVKQTQDTATSYFLDSTSGSTDEPGTNPDAEKVRNTTVTAGSYIGIAYAAQLFDVSLHNRVGNRDWINPVTGEKHSTSLWMQHTMNHERFRDTTSQLRMRATGNTTMLGGDFIQYTADNGGLAYAGLMGGYSTMDTKSGSVVTGLHSKAETDAWAVGFYGGWKADEDNQTGPYVDGWVMFTHAKSDVSGVDQHVEDIKGQGLSASIEVGWGVPAGSITNDDGSVTQMTFEPHASVTWFGMEFDDLHTQAQDVAFEGKNNVRTRLGARAVISEKGNDHFNAFVEANWVHNTQEYGATISGLTVDQAGARNQAETRLGVDWRITDGLSAWGRVGASFGSNNYSDREGSVGIRYQF